MPGIEVIYNDIAYKVPIKQNFNIDINCIEINYCLTGHVEVEVNSNKYSFMDDGDICLYSYNIEAASCDFGIKPFKGITIMIYFPEVVESLNCLLCTNEFTEKNVLNDVFNADNCIIYCANDSIEHIFKELFVIPESFNKHLMKLKVMELLLYIIANTSYQKSEAIYFSRTSLDKIKDARKIILNNLDKRITVKEISKMVNLNSTDLEKGFKNMYGSTIFSYSKACKMKKAKELLLDSSLTVLDVALNCGYGSCGKFAKAFKDAYDVTPNNYRKNR
jgi:AraC-like DNA-binding protein